MSEANPPPSLFLPDPLGDFGTYVGEYEISASRSFDVDLSQGLDATCNKSLGSWGLLDESLPTSQLLISVPIVVILDVPDGPLLNVHFEFVIGGDLSSLIGDLCRKFFGVVGDEAFPDGKSPLPAVTDPPVDALMERGVVEERLLALPAENICDVNGLINVAPLGDVDITCAANLGKGRDIGSTLAFKWEAPNLAHMGAKLSSGILFDPEVLAVLVCSVSGLSSNKGVPGRLLSEISSAPATRASEIPEAPT